eukprot:Phypoly_transcript_01674.p1 GENE.Phypoly_transcript_01674~~Phypoly_transcript_01674.p1  ORF type:complete len:324 (+),score=55.37 Phypoly_transcript_01674:1982-2953(+)
MTYDHCELLGQLSTLNFSAASNTFSSGYNTTIKGSAPKTIQTVSSLFSKDITKAMSDIGNLVARMFPTASAERAAVILDITVFGFIADDLLEDAALSSDSEAFDKLHMLMLRLVRNDSFSEDEYPEYQNLIRFTRPIFTKFQALASRTLLNRFAYTYQEYLQGVQWEASLQPNQIPDFETCKNVKRHVGAWLCYFVLAEFAREIEVPITVRGNLEVQKFVTLACDIASYDNDTFSLKKEIRDGVVSNTIVITYLHGAKRLQDALDRILEMRKQTESEILAITSNLPHFGKDDKVAREYINALTCVIGGNFEWCSKTTRYQDPK